MEHTGANQQMVFRLFEPSEKIAHQFGNSLWWRCHVDETRFAEHSDAATALSPGIVG